MCGAAGHVLRHACLAGGCVQSAAEAGGRGGMGGEEQKASLGISDRSDEAEILHRSFIYQHHLSPVSVECKEPAVFA